MDLVWSFLRENFPGPELILWLGPAGLLYALLWLYISGRLKADLGWKTGYSRKVFHFSIFFGAGLVHLLTGFPGIIVFGSAVSLIIFYALYKGDGNILYEAMAREKDKPRRTYYILIPYLATLAGGCFSNLFFRPAGAFYGYLVTGFGDAIGEPVGTRFGKHKYRVPSRRDVKSYRSIEGSAAVMCAAYTALLLGGILSGEQITWNLAGKMLLIASAGTLTEAVSPHGWDNFLLQFLTSGLAWYLIL